MLTYTQAYDLIIQAYFKDELEPYDPRFCFCGNLCGVDNAWHGDTYIESHYDYKGYTGNDFAKMEWALIGGLDKAGLHTLKQFIPIMSIPKYEHLLFIGMSAALDVLKEIHRSRGEDVDGDLKPFVKREFAGSLIK